MTAERWETVQQMFSEILEQTEGNPGAVSERNQLLDQLCNGDAELRAEVESLLGSYNAEYLEQPAGTIAQVAQIIDQQMMEGQEIGAYRVIRQLGDGGMGSVYLAERKDHQFSKRVAVKVVKRGMDSEEVVRRFRSEQHILASLNHANIAQLFDAGIAPDGRPYFVMEFVENAAPIDRHCDQQGLTIGQRLELFCTVCSAVQYAHQNLVVHRDLKAANILVGAGSGIKLLDFGIAKLLNERDRNTWLVQTRFEARVLTLDNAAPEQIRGEAITTATDIYALGVLLYQLLCGHRPYQIGSRTTAEIEQIICHHIPDTPSSMVARSVESPLATETDRPLTPAGVADARSTRPERLMHELRGDLDTIVLKAMQKEPSRRYTTVNQFAEDIQRWLRGMPILAQPDSIGYRIRKFLGRHQMGVTIAGGAFVSLAAFSVATAKQSRRIQRQAQEITRQRDKAEQVATFLKDVFQVSDPAINHGATVTAQELLEKGAERIEAELGNQPQVLADLQFVIAEVFMNLGLFDRAQAMAERSLALRRTLFLPPHILLAESLFLLAGIMRFNERYEDSQQLYQESLAMQQKLFGKQHTAVAATLNEMGITAGYQGHVEQARTLLEESLAMRRLLHGEEHPNIARTLNNLGLLLKRNGQPEAAEKLYQQALQLQRKLFGNDHPDVARTLNNLAATLRALGKVEESELCDREALAIRQRIYKDHPETAQSLNNLASALLRKGKLAEAEVLFRQAAELWQMLYRDNHPQVARGLSNLAHVQRLQGNDQEAEELLEKAVEILENHHGANHPETARVVAAIAALRYDAGDYRKATTLYRHAHAAYALEYGQHHERTAVIAHKLAEALLQTGEVGAATQLLEESYQVLQRINHQSAGSIGQLLASIKG